MWKSTLFFLFVVSSFRNVHLVLRLIVGHLYVLHNGFAVKVNNVETSLVVTWII